MEKDSENVEENNSSKKVEIDSGNNIDNNYSNNERKNISKDNRKKNRRRRYGFLIRKFGCLRAEDGGLTSEKTDTAGNFDMEASDGRKDRAPPSHLIVMVNGIIGSAQNWRYAAKQFVKAYPDDVIVHCSDANSNMMTFDGVDVMGTRLANEVISVIQRHPNLRRISFIGHSLGGLVARYAIAKLYSKESLKKISEENGECRDESNDSRLKGESAGKIAGLEPMNFITSATPHLGSRWHKQVPMFCGFYSLEKVALHGSWVLGKTGKHLFLTDIDDGKPPLLLQMANDSEDLKFISALGSFKRRVAYANAGFDNLVGWSTSSLRRRSELPKRKHLSRNDKYPHIMNIETAETDIIRDDVPIEAKLEEGKSNDIEEAMIRGLTKVGWERIDVSFRGSKQRYLAHSTIQVKTKFFNSDGADVIQHMVDNFLL